MYSILLAVFSEAKKNLISTLGIEEKLISSAFDEKLDEKRRFSACSCDILLKKIECPKK